MRYLKAFLILLGSLVALLYTEARAAEPKGLLDVITVSVSKQGTGSGFVSSQTGLVSVVIPPGGIQCGTQCSATFIGLLGTISLKATPDAGSTFAGWGGDCSSCGSNTTCDLSALLISLSSFNCTATFNTSGGGGGGTNFALAVSKQGTGNGTVTSSPSGINCGTQCNAIYPANTQVTLTAAADSGSTFAGWGGDCSSCGSNTVCNVTMDGNKLCTATFNTSGSGGGGTQNFTLSVSKSGTGTGTVLSSPPGINCGSDCSEAYPNGTVVTLVVIPDSGSTFAGWGGDCASCGNAPGCSLTMDANKFCTATFNTSGSGGGGGGGSGGGGGGTQPPGGGTNTHNLSLSKKGTGSGQIFSSPEGINCGSKCSADFPAGSTVTLSAVPDAGSIFSSWGGDCSVCANKAVCSISMDKDKNCVAFFNSIAGGGPPYALTIVKQGNGDGIVTSDPPGIDCGGSCVANFPSLIVIQLKAKAGAGSVFKGWGGDCESCGANDTCNVRLFAADKTCTAIFDHIGGGGGCSMSASGGTLVNLFAWLLLPVLAFVRRVFRKI
ncbi:MAG: hypothetical protein KNN13_08370 [Hydrogenobacter thermophilus]|uniref:InlB B-repeat-containing protein n=1 Tax=Hydrogenobacter thermophilus TaxID=940 RepID=UPI001C78199C|nr:hypothetical protein [Hydrogenobacter thermophilus]QWK19493.1 MAG: hypothetical protein KNN13_08370 [Hydrogenobacter thermophilus]